MGWCVREASYASEAEFMTALESRHGAARVEPHRQALVGAALTMNARLVLIAIIGFVALVRDFARAGDGSALRDLPDRVPRSVAISAAVFWNALVSASVTFVFPGSCRARLRRHVPGVRRVRHAAAPVRAGVRPGDQGRTLEELEG